MASVGSFLVEFFRLLASAADPPKWLDTPCTTSAVLALRCYRLTASRFSGRQCMFHPGCSQYALSVLHEKGWVRGRASILARLDRCSGVYVMTFDGLECTMTTSDGSVFSEADIAPGLVADYRQNHASLIRTLTSTDTH